MEPAPFCHWLQGILDTNPTLTDHQVKLIKDKLNTVFVHVVEMPPMDPTPPHMTSADRFHGHGRDTMVKC